MVLKNQEVPSGAQVSIFFRRRGLNLHLCPWPILAKLNISFVAFLQLNLRVVVMLRKDTSKSVFSFRGLQCRLAVSDDADHLLNVYQTGPRNIAYIKASMRLHPINNFFQN